jgi:hypothetical protein
LDAPLSDNIWTLDVSAGGVAIASARSVEDGAAIIKDTIDAFGAIHVLVNK